MPSSKPSTFRFRDLPSEIRNKIYRELLCDFRPQPTTFDAGSMLEFAQALHKIDTTILRTSTAIYREAYDVMVKTNRFIKVTSVRGLPMRLLLNCIKVPIVSAEKSVVERFRGYVLAVDLGKKHPSHDHENDFVQPCNLMILHRDLETFCLALTDGDAMHAGFSEELRISITVAPIVAEREATKYASPLDDFFSESTQKALLAPFTTHLRGYKGVKIQGYVDKALASSVREEMGRDRWSDPDEILASFTAAKQEGSRLFQQRKFDDASLAWQDAAVDIDKMLASSSWPKLVKRGGERFISQLVELYFLLRLNIGQVQITTIQTGPGSAFAGVMGEDALNSAARSILKDHWMVGYKYRPSDKHKAKLLYRLALIKRLLDKTTTAEDALRYIDRALQLQPGDMAILQERNNIVAWLERGY
jgi:hypothetical protein